MQLLLDVVASYACALAHACARAGVRSSLPAHIRLRPVPWADMECVRARAVHCHVPAQGIPALVHRCASSSMVCLRCRALHSCLARRAAAPCLELIGRCQGCSACPDWSLGLAWWSSLLYCAVSATAICLIASPHSMRAGAWARRAPAPHMHSHTHTHTPNAKNGRLRRRGHGRDGVHGGRVQHERPGQRVPAVPGRQRRGGARIRRGARRLSRRRGLGRARPRLTGAPVAGQHGGEERVRAGARLRGCLAKCGLRGVPGAGELGVVLLAARQASQCLGEVRAVALSGNGSGA